MKSESARIPQSDHPNPTWAEAGERVYHYSEAKAVHTTATVAETEKKQIAVPDDGAGGVLAGGPKNLGIRWDRLVPKLVQACQKKMKTLLEFIGQVRALKDVHL